jgi:hypothetical protein
MYMHIKLRRRYKRVGYANITLEEKMWLAIDRKLHADKYKWVEEEEEAKLRNVLNENGINDDDSAEIIKQFQNGMKLDSSSLTITLNKLAERNMGIGVGGGAAASSVTGGKGGGGGSSIQGSVNREHSTIAKSISNSMVTKGSQGKDMHRVRLIEALSVDDILRIQKTPTKYLSQREVHIEKD